VTERDEYQEEEALFAQTLPGVVVSSDTLLIYAAAEFPPLPIGYGYQ
jgi:hypothetical protein